MPRSSISNVRRRGAVYWWRLVIALCPLAFSKNSTISCELSLRTREPGSARGRAKALTAYSERLAVSLRDLVANSGLTDDVRGATFQAEMRSYRDELVHLEAVWKMPPEWAAVGDCDGDLDAWFDLVPVTIGKSPRDRNPETTFQQIVDTAAERVAKGDLSAGDICLSPNTTNKHWHNLARLHADLCSRLPGAVPIDVSKYISPDHRDAGEARDCLTLEQGEALFRLPPRGAAARVSPTASRPGRRSSTTRSTGCYCSCGIPGHAARKSANLHSPT